MLTRAFRVQDKDLKLKLKNKLEFDPCDARFFLKVSYISVKLTIFLECRI